MSKILGKNVTLSIVIDASPQEIELIGCARECTLITTMNTAPKSTVGSGKYQEFTGLSIGWNVSVTGLATVGENMDMQTLTGMQFSLLPVIISFKETTATGDIYYSGYALITSIQRTGNYNDAESYTVQLLGTGELLIDSVAVYGNYPTNITAVLVSGPLLLITWTDVPYPVPSSYTVRITDINLNTTILYDNASSGDTYPVDPDHRYAIGVQGDYGALGKSLFSPDIYYPS